MKNAWIRYNMSHASPIHCWSLFIFKNEYKLSQTACPCKVGQCEIMHIRKIASMNNAGTAFYMKLQHHQSPYRDDHQYQTLSLWKICQCKVQRDIFKVYCPLKHTHKKKKNKLLASIVTQVLQTTCEFSVAERLHNSLGAGERVTVTAKRMSNSEPRTAPGGGGWGGCRKILSPLSAVKAKIGPSI